MNFESCLKLEALLVLCLIKHDALKTYGETEIQIHALLFPSLDRGHGHFNRSEISAG